MVGPRTERYIIGEIVWIRKTPAQASCEHTRLLPLRVCVCFSSEVILAVTSLLVDVPMTAGPVGMVLVMGSVWVTML